MEQTKILAGLAIILVFSLFVQAASVFVFMAYGSTTANSLAVNYGDVVDIVISADSISESHMNIDVNLFDDSGNIISNLIDIYTTHDSYSTTYSFGLSIYLNPGDYTIHAIVTAASGSTHQRELFLTVLTPPKNNHPIITSAAITEIDEGTYYNYQVIATDADGDILTYSLTTNPSWISISSSGLISGTAPLVNSDSSYPIIINVSDSKDSTTQNFTLNVKDIPLPENNSPIASNNNYSTDQDTSVLTTMSAIDADGDSLTYSVVSNPSDGVLTGSGNTRTYTPNSGYTGTDSYTYKAYDETDYSNTAIITITVNPTPSDKTAPIITLLGSNPINVELGAIYIDAGASALDDTDGDITSGIIIINNVNTNILDSYTVTYDVSDFAGNSAAQIVRIVNVIDTTAPTASITFPADGTTYFSSINSLTYTTSDLALESCWYSTDSGITNSTSETCSTSFSITSEEGTNTWTIYANDTSGNIGSDTVTFEVDTYIPDTTAPIVNITSPLSGDNVDGSKLITFTDNELTNPECSIDNINWITCISGTTTLNDITGFDSLPDGTFTLYLRDTDLANNTGTDSETGIIKDTSLPDTNAPKIVITHPWDGSSYGSDITSLTYNVLDAEGNLADCWYSIDLGITNSTPVTCGAEISITSEEGTNTWTIYANDTSGNIGSDTVTFEVDTSTPKKKPKKKTKTTKSFISPKIEEKGFMPEAILSLGTGKINYDKKILFQKMINWLLILILIIAIVTLIVLVKRDKI